MIPANGGTWSDDSTELKSERAKEDVRENGFVIAQQTTRASFTNENKRELKAIKVGENIIERSSCFQALLNISDVVIVLNANTKISTEDRFKCWD